MSDELSPEAVKAIGVIEKLLRLAGRNPNEHEAAVAQAKAMELMTAYNLDMAAVEENSGESGKRSDEKLKGGHYKFQRDLWESVAELNFCMYFSMTEFERTKKWVPNKTGTGFVRAFGEKRIRTHRLVGRTVNTRATRVMAEYLEQAIERVTRERLGERFQCDIDMLARSQLYSQWANSFREGVAERVCDKIRKRRRDMQSEEREKAEEQARRTREAGFAGVSMETAITIATVQERETQANYDFIHGEGAWARREAERAAYRQRQAERLAAAEKEWAEWAAANPEEAAREAKKEEARQRRNAARRTSYGRGWREPAYKGDWGARRAGYDAGADVSIDPQAAHQRPVGALG